MNMQGEDYERESASQNWYFRQSKAVAGRPRCPLANVKLCPRYYASRSVAGKKAWMNPMAAIEAKKLDEFWGKHPLHSEDSIAGPEAREDSVANFCPEIGYEIFGVFASTIARHSGEDRRIYEKDLAARGIPADHWRQKFWLLKPQHYSECSEYSVLAALSGKDRQTGKTQRVGGPSQREKWLVLVRDEFTCYYCGKSPQRHPGVVLEVDHKKSVKNGGGKSQVVSSSLDNLVTACSECNRGKSSDNFPADN